MVTKDVTHCTCGKATCHSLAGRVDGKKQRPAPQQGAHGSAINSDGFTNELTGFHFSSY